MAALKIFFDGGCRPNPGPIETAVVIAGVAHVRTDHGHGTNMDAEWLALIEAVRLAREGGHADVILIGDSAAVIGQARGTATCRGENLRHLAAFRAAVGTGAIRLRQIGRAQNLAGIALARRHGR